MYAANVIALLLGKKITLQTARFAMSTRPDAVCGRGGSYLVGVDIYGRKKSSLLKFVQTEIEGYSKTTIVLILTYLVSCSVILADLFIWRVI